MKKLLIALLFPVLCKAQAHLGKTEVEIRGNFPDVSFTRGWTKDGQKYLMGKMPYGTFVYYFGSNGETTFNIQIPTTIQDANARVEIYNGKYVITSKKSWTASLEGGAIMKSDMVCVDE